MGGEVGVEGLERVGRHVGLQKDQWRPGAIRTAIGARGWSVAYLLP
jgi:hypothetical protein